VMLRFFRKRTPPFDHAKLAAGVIALLARDANGWRAKSKL